MGHEPESNPPSNTRARISPAASLLVWSVPALLSTLETVVFASQQGRPIAVWRAFVSEAPQWYAWALFTPLIVALAERFPLAKRPHARNIGIHLGASLVASLAIALADAAVGELARPSSRPFTETARAWFLGQLPATTVAYFAIVGVAYAIGSTLALAARERQAAALQAELRDAQLAALRMQLQPHFLFNSLNAIMALVRDQDTTRAIDALAKLSEVLRRASTAANDHVITLEEEIAFVRQYLEIEQLRFGERLRVDIQLPTHLRTARVPSFVLQPFVENALKHGVLRDHTGNRVAVAASSTGTSLRLIVEDDGRGLGDGGAPAAGVGIANARARLFHMYGGAAELTVANAPAGRGVTVDIRLPLTEGAT